MTITDTVTQATFSHTFQISVPIVGSSTAYVGSQVERVALTAIQDIIDWTYVSGASSAAPPTITTQPANQTVTAGQTATFTVVASGTAPLSYQ